MTITLRVYGDPAPGGSKRAFIPAGWKRAIITDANNRAKPWMQLVKQAALDAHKGPLLQGALKVSALFIIKRPSSHFGSGQKKFVLKDSAPRYAAKRPDALKLMRPVEDACTGILWSDDSQIVQ